ncbi:MAG: phage-like protein [Hyphomonadaceae bacterium]|nr:MAG: phage-like protein [Hyphomonadaceae bacterium]KAF0184284.1 MAG: phage-like protein [Hyphomonadaceae bacterium]
MPSIGAGVIEIRIKSQFGAFRVIYLAKLVEAIYVLHAFQKKTQKTNQHDIEIAKKRLAAI